MSRTAIKNHIKNMPGDLLWSLFLVASFFLIWPAVARGQDNAVAVGDGFIVTLNDVNQLAAYIGETGFSSSEKQHLKAAVRTRVFAEEAIALGLGEPADEEKEKRVKLEHTIGLSMRYMRSLLDAARVDDLVIESYYLSHPEKYETLLNDDIREEIRCRIVGVKRMDIFNKAFERLKQKYNVRILVPEGAES